MEAKLRVVIADDERPARSLLKSMLNDIPGIEIVGEADSGTAAIEVIETAKPDLAFLDLQMPETSGLEVVKLLRKRSLPLIAFVTAYDEFAIEAFELNAVDYLLKPVERKRLLETVQRAHRRLDNADLREVERENLKATVEFYESGSVEPFLDRIPLKQNGEFVLVPVDQIVSIVAEGEMLRISTVANRTFMTNKHLKDLEARLNKTQFARLSRGAIVNVAMISKIRPMPGGVYDVHLKNDQCFSSSRIHSRVFRSQHLKI